MKKTIFNLSFSLGLLSFSFPVLAMDNHYTSFEDYEGAMHKKSAPVVVIVGCGHGAEYKHSHADSWCVNLDNHSGHPLDKKSPEEFKNYVQYDEVLDISTWHFKKPNQDRIRENITPSFVKYKNKCDVVLLERPTRETLNEPWTVWNTVHMLKVGGELLIDSCSGYTGYMYQDDDCLKSYKEAKEKNNTSLLKRIQGKSFYLSVCLTNDLDSVDYTQGAKAANDSEKIKRYEIQFNCNQNSYEMSPIADYLARWSLNEIVNVRHATQPYANQHTQLLSATKTQATEDTMEEWAGKIQALNPVAVSMHLKNRQNK